MNAIAPEDLIQLLRRNGMRPSVQRLAIAGHVLTSTAHPTADQVMAAVQLQLPVVSMATVYNTLHALVDAGLLREIRFGDSVAYDPCLDRHHHFIDERTGAVTDIPWDAIDVHRVDRLPGITVRDYQVVIHGTFGALPDD